MVRLLLARPAALAAGPIPRDKPNRARAKSVAPFMVPVHTDVVTVYEMYLIERAAVPTAAECDFVFVNVFHEPLGAPMRYATAHQLLAGLSRKAGLARRVPPTCSGTALVARNASPMSSAKKSSPKSPPAA